MAPLEPLAPDTEGTKSRFRPSKARSAEIGVTNFNVAQLRRLVDAGVPIASNQPQYSPVDLRPQKQMIDYCLGIGARQVCYGTLAGGFFSKAWLGKPEPAGDFDNRSLTKYKLIIDDFGGWELFQDLLGAFDSIPVSTHDPKRASAE